MSADKLKSCPFCGSTQVRLQRPVRDGQLTWQARCAQCGAEICHPDRERALALWNTRVDTYRARHLAYETALALLRKT